MIFFKFNNVGQLISTNKNASENQVSQGSVRANEIFVTFTGLLNNLSDTTNYSCYLTFIRNDGQSINDLRASATSYTFDGVTYYGYSYLINNKAITAVAGQLQISFRLIDLTVSTDNAVERTSAVESVSVVGTTISTSVSINLTQAQIQAIDQAIANAPATTYQTYVASDSEFEAQINASETTGKENKIPTIGQVCNKFKNMNIVDLTTFNTALANKVDVATYNIAIGSKADLSYVNDEFAKYYKKEQVYSKSEIDAQHAELATKQHVDEIDGKIPNNASSSNKLVTLSTLNDAINQLTATKRGTFTSLAELYVVDGNENDYAYYQYEVTRNGSTAYKLDRYVWQLETRTDEDTGIETHWYFDVAVNNTSFTQAQIDALNSGVTEEKLDGIDTALANRYTKSQTDDLFYKKTQIDTMLASYYDKTAVDTLLTSYVTISTLNTTLANYYNKTEVDTELNKIKRFDVSDGNLVSDNLFNGNINQTLNGVNVNCIGSVLKLNGTCTSRIQGNGNGMVVFLDNNTTYTVTSSNPINTVGLMVLRNGNFDRFKFGDNGILTFTTDSSGTWAFIIIVDPNTYSNYSTNIMLNKGSTAEPYVPYFSADERYVKKTDELHRHKITMVANKSYDEPNKTFYFEIINRISTQIDTNGFSQMNGVWLGYTDVGSNNLKPVIIGTAYGATGVVRVTILDGSNITSNLWAISTMYDEIA